MLDTYIKRVSANFLLCGKCLPFRVLPFNFCFVKTKKCMSLPAPLSSSLWFIVPLYLSFRYLIYLAITLSTPLYIAKNVCFRDISLNVQWDYTADLYLKTPAKYSKFLRRKLPSRVIFEMYAYKRIKFM